ncbi:hypothetical protein [Crocosphaera chwakensis]|uniref:Uncharacterized protein n=1 Tax=Crocosphaera chwakensis CCY0110 TaxID=391612 RepID=A3IW25_9CHRO|nr:hypothetical protein [Crocosphaera chwakensis]EAZ89336.1 hypothetical protein CY0110_20540 [Crocosphaera chwakensis CCY0110]
MSLLFQSFIKKAYRVLTAFLLSVILLLSLAWGGENYNCAFADVLERDATTIQKEISTDQIDYEAAKEKRREAQAKRSEEASERGEQENEAKKLDLDELKSDLMNKFTGEEK